MHNSLDPRRGKGLVCIETGREIKSKNPQNVTTLFGIVCVCVSMYAFICKPLLLQISSPELNKILFFSYATC